MANVKSANANANNAAAGTKKRQRKNVPVGMAFINATFNNTIIVITDLQGNTIVWSSAGSHGFRGAKKSTPYAAQITAEHVGKAALDHGMKTLQEVKVKGPGSGRESALRALQAVGFTVISIKDTTPIPHNGCRRRKRRRV